MSDDIVERVLRELCFHWEGGPLPSERDAKEAHAALGRDHTRTKVALLRELAAELATEAYKPDPPTDDRIIEASREGYREGLKWAAKKLGWRADALEGKR